jgi:aminopeptidase N
MNCFLNHYADLLYPDEAMETITDGDHVRFATTDDYLNLVNRLTGEDYSWLFEVYLRNSELPVLSADRKGENLTLEWEIVDNMDFPVPVELSVDGEVITLIPISKKMELQIPDNARLEIDPDSRILMELKSSGLTEE